MTIGNDYFPVFSPKEYERRFKAVRKGMKEKGLDCLLIYGAYHFGGNDTGQVNAVYLSSYAGIPHTYVIVPLQAEPTLVMGIPLHVPNAKDCSYIEDVRPGGFDLVYTVADRFKELKLEKANIGIVGPMGSWFGNTLPYEHFQYLKETFPQANFPKATDWYEGIRIVKSEEEIRLMEQSGLLSDVAHEEIFLATRPGIRHSDLRRVADGVANRFGGSFPFSHIGSTSMKNPQRFYPDFYPTYRTIEAGDVVMTEIALGYGVYFGKVWGTYFVGEPTKEYLKMFNLAVSVHDKTIATLKPGMKGRDANKLLKPFKTAGLINGAPLVMGWSCYNHPPHVGVVEGSPSAAMVKPSDLEFVFVPGVCVSIISFPVTPDLKKGVWIGTTCVFTKDGLKKLHRYPVTELRVAPV
ncbi:MAG: M24 family metallopeptidase [Pseudomonadota bacterium]